MPLRTKKFSPALPDVADDEPPQAKVERLTHAVRERLRYIDCVLNYVGQVTRACLTDHFGVSVATATQDLIIYRSLVPGNARLDRLRRHVRAPGFVALFEHPARSALSLVASTSVAPMQGVGGVSLAGMPLLHEPGAEVLSAITRAIAAQASIDVRYQSSTSGAVDRVIVPHTLVDDGLRLHVRAFDRLRGEFRDFNLCRFLAVPTPCPHPVAPEEGAAHDEQWTRWASLALEVHPHHARDAETIGLDYGMRGGICRIKVRAALCGYLLRLHRVDCSSDHGLRAPDVRLALRDARLTLHGIESAKLAPGYDGAA